MFQSTRNRPSATARAVAVGRAVGLEGIADPLATRVVPGIGRHLIRGARRLRQVPGGDRMVTAAMGGLNVHAALRMAAIDAATVAALTAGIRQVVVVGAGFDTRGWRLDALAGCRLIEVDLPATQGAKRDLVRGVTPIASVAFVSADLSRDTLDGALVGSPFVPESATLWIWEAVTPYLPDAAVRQTLGAVADLSAPGSRLAMTFAHGTGPGGPVRQAAEVLARHAFSLIGEPLLSSYDDWDVADMVSDSGFADPIITGSMEWALAQGLSLRSLPWAAERLVTAAMPVRRA